MHPSRPARHARNLTVISIALSLALAAAMVWIAYRAVPGTDEGWHRLSDVGSAFGIISAVISAVALVGVAISLNVQRRHTRIAQLEVVLALRTQLLQVAVDQPAFLRIWGFDATEGKERAYTSMVFSYLNMAYSLGLLTNFELTRYCAAAFREPAVLAFWAASREVYLNGAKSAREREFAGTVEREFDAAQREFDTAQREFDTAQREFDTGQRDEASLPTA